MDKKRKFTIILTILFILLFIFICYEKLIKVNDTFFYSENGSYGIAIVKGYAEVIDREYDCYCPEGAVCGACPEPHKEILFHVLETNSPGLEKTIDKQYNVDNDNKTILLGCVNEHKDFIHYFNDADIFLEESKYNTKYISLDNDDSKKIMSSNINNPITLRLEKYKFTGNEKSSMCYSYFSKIEIID